MKRDELYLPRALCFVLVALLAGEVPFAFVVTSLAFLAFSIVRVAMGKAELARWLLGVLAPLAAVAVYFSMGTLIGKEPSGALLAVLAGLKALESRDDSDERSLSLIGLFLVCVVFLFRGDLWMTLFGTTATLGFLYLLFRTMDAPLDRAGSWRWTWKLSLRALPLALLLFFIVPRLQHQWIWKLGSVGSTGFREELSPILVDRIVEDDTPVLRALWTTGEPLASLYWRGAALEEVKGFSWSVSRRSDTLVPQAPAFSSSTVAVDYVLEARSGAWSFAPEGTVRIEDFETGQELRFDRDRSSWRWSLPVSQRKKLRAWIDPRAAVMDLSNARLLETPTLPPEATEFVRAAIGSQKLASAEKARRLQEQFAKEGFVYTRSPGRLPDLQSFLKTKRGFCEHYASALALLLRKTDVPARVVVGYLGGRRNPVGEFTLVTESDAHAWVEFLDESGHWKTADATAFVPPLDPRVDRRLLDGPGEWSEATWWDRTRWSLEAVNYQFTLFFMNFDIQTQKELWARVRGGGFAPAVVVFLGLLTLTAFFLRGRRAWTGAKEPAEVRRYRRLLVQAENDGLALPPSTTPTEVAALLKDRWPERAAEIAATIDHYVKRRFARQ